MKKVATENVDYRTFVRESPFNGRFEAEKSVCTNEKVEIERRGGRAIFPEFHCEKSRKRHGC